MASFLFWHLGAIILVMAIPLAFATPVFDSPSSLDFSHLDICQDPSFDAAVAVSDSQMLLFKGSETWLLDLLNYQVSRPSSNHNIIKACRGTEYTIDHLIDPYYIWNQHSDFKQLKGRICVESVSCLQMFA